MDEVQKEDAGIIEELLGLERRIVGVALLSSQKYSPNAHGLRFCEALMKACEGRTLLISGSGSLCHASDVSLGIEEPRYAQINPRVVSKVKQIIIGPISEWEFKDAPQVIISILKPAQAMHIANALGAKPTFTDGEIAVCGLTAYAFNTGKPSLSLLCNSCRLYAGVRDNELALSVGFEDFKGLMKSLSKLEGARRMRLVDRELTPSSRLIHRILAERGSSTQSELLHSSALSERSLRNSLKQLVGHGVVSESVDFSDRRRRIYELS